jgi:hypothetical protein
VPNEIIMVSQDAAELLLASGKAVPAVISEYPLRPKFAASVVVKSGG